MPVALVHGNPETDAIWDDLRPRLARTNVVTLSPPGFGAPVPLDFGATSDDYVSWLVKEVEATTMAKAYWVTTYRSISNPAAFEAYARLAGPAIVAGGGRFLVRGNPEKVFESGLMQRVVVSEFDSIEQAVKTHDGDAYQAALKALDNGADRDIRIVEGVE